MIAGHELIGDRSGRDTLRFHAKALQGPNALKRDVGYTNIHQGEHDNLNPILLSEEFSRSNRFSIGDVSRVDYFNDHLKHRNLLTSDHGMIRATIRLRQCDATELRSERPA